MRGLKWCNSTNCRFKYVHRDENSAVSIEQIYHWKATDTPLPASYTEPYLKNKEKDSRDLAGNSSIRLVSVMEVGGTKRTLSHL